MYYLLEVSFCWLSFYALYAIFFKRETFFGGNRIYLLATLFAGLLIPLIEVPIQPVMPEIEAVALEVKDATDHSLSEVYMLSQKTISVANDAFNFDVKQILWGIYLFGVLLSFSRFLIGIAQIKNLYSSATITKKEGYTLVETKLPHIPFSFFNYLFFYTDTTYNTVEKEQILRHELAHIEGGHSWDVVFFELLKMFFWFNPLIYFYKSALRDVHEFLADASVLTQASKQEYGRLLIAQSSSRIKIALANNFNYSQLQKRIEMMTINKSSDIAYLKYILSIPLSILLFLCLAQAELFAQEQGSFSETTSLIKRPDGKTIIMTTLTDDKKDAQGNIIYKKPQVPATFGDCQSLETVYQQQACSYKYSQTYMLEKLKTPSIAQAKGIKGIVLVEFEIDKNGKVRNTQVVKKIGGGCEEEVVRVLTSMPQWTPAKQDGKNVVSHKVLSIEFPLKESRLQQVKALPKQPAKSEQKTPWAIGCDSGDHGQNWLCTINQLVEKFSPLISYPLEAQKVGMWGSVSLKFEIDEKGNTTDVKVGMSSCELCHEDALSIGNNYKDKWLPKTVNGKSVKSSINIPLSYVPKLGQKVPGLADTYIITDKMPHPVDCTETSWKRSERHCTYNSWLSYLSKNLKYPTKAKNNRTEGMAVINTIIDEQGNITNAKIIQNPGNGTGEEALRLVKQLPKWVGGKHQGKPVKVMYNFRVPFKL